MTDAFLRADQSQDLALGIQVDTEATAVPVGNRLAKPVEPLRLRVAMVRWIARCPRQGADDRRWRRDVRIADAQADDVHATRYGLSALTVDLDEEVRR